jgi:hypothetical protein
MSETNLFAVSIRQPWAWLIVHGYKDVENRTWITKYRGEISIHASQKSDTNGYKWVIENFDIILPPLSSFECGGIVGEARLIDCVNVYKSPWFFGPYGFILREAHPTSFQKMKGQLGIFKIQIPNKE